MNPEEGGDMSQHQVALLDRQLHISKNSPKWVIWGGNFNELLTICHFECDMFCYLVLS